MSGNPFSNPSILNPIDAPSGNTSNVSSKVYPIAKPFKPASKKTSPVHSFTGTHKSQSLLQTEGLSNAILIISNCDKIKPNIYCEVLCLAFCQTEMLNPRSNLLDDKTASDFKNIGETFTNLKKENLRPFDKLLKAETFLYSIFDHKIVCESISMNDLLQLAAIFLGFCRDILEASSFRKDYKEWRGLLPRFGAIILKDLSTKVLLVRTNEHSKFGFPRGKAEAFETPEKSAQREVLEEVGVNIDISAFKVSDKISVKPRGTTHHYFPVNIKQSIKLNLQKCEIQKAIWVDISSIDKQGKFPDPSFPTKSYQMQVEPLEGLERYKHSRFKSKSFKTRQRVNPIKW